MLLLVAACSQASATKPPVAKKSLEATPGSPSGAPAPSVAQTTVPARFLAIVSRLTRDLAAEMRGSTWHKGCPVGLSGLRLLTLRYWGFDGNVHEGPMVVNALVSRDVVRVFRRLFEARFPIKILHLAAPYRGPQDDDPNDRRDWTVGFNCRPVLTARGPLPRWSQHASGLAIDINPIENPYVTGDGFVKNNHARRYRNRSLRRPGMIRPGDVVVRAFAAVGWKWGGYWMSEKDYMHFSLTGG